MSKTVQYFRTVASNKNIEVVYDSETEEVTITIQHRLKDGTPLDRGIMRIHPTYIEPLKLLLDEVTPPESEATSQEKG